MLRLSPLLALALLALALPAAASAASTRGTSVATGRLLVTMAPTHRAQAAAAHAVAARAGAQTDGAQVPQIGLVTVRPRRGESMAALAARLRTDPRVRSVQVEHRFVPRLVPNDPAFTVPETAPGTPPGTVVEWWAAAENLPAMWDLSRGTGARVAIVDTGVDTSHPELASRVVHAADFTYGGPGSAATDEAGHGTHVASLACAQGGNGAGIAGAGYGCSLIVEKTDLSDSANAAAVVDATRHGADAINMSFGTDGTTSAPEAEVNALSYARNHGAVLVAAAADDPVTEQGDPSNVLQPTGTGPDLTKGYGLSVTAAQYGGTRAPFAGLGTQISLAAYGAFLYRTGLGPRGLLGAFPAGSTSLETGDATQDPPLAPCVCRTTFQGDRRYAYISGTSMAAPQVAAVAAVMRHVNPDLPPADVERILKQTATRPAGTGWTPELGWGILNGGAALAAARGVDRTPPVVRLSVRSRTRRSVTVQIAASDQAPAGVVSSGVKTVQLYRTVAGGQRRLLRTTTRRLVRLAVPAGGSLALTPRAIDKAGNAGRLSSRATLRARPAP